MISRRRILSRSRDELMNGQYPDNYNPYEEEEDVWYSKDKLMKDHILEILNKWEQIDDEIWAKLICMERNRRVAKAYARAPILTINGSDDGFDGYRIGLNGFDNPLRDPKTDSVKHHIGDGVKIRMDDDGNILIKRLAKSNVYVKGWQTDSNGGGQQNQSQNQQQEYQTSVSMEIIRNNGLLELNKAVRLFDMKRFQQNMNRELRRAYPDRRKLENQCICLIGFVKDSPDILDLPVWVMIINIVAMDMLKSKLPPAISKRQSVPNLVSLFDRTKTTIVEEDPYTIPGNNSSSSGSRSSGHYVSTGPMSPPPMNSNGRNGKKSSPTRNNHHQQDPKPPKLPPRDFERNKNKSRLLCSKKSKNNSNNHSNNNSSSAIKDCEEENNYSILPNNPRAYDDPYYSGFSARVPNFAKKTNGGGSSMMMSNTNNAQLLLPFKSSAYNQHEFLARKVPTSGFLNSYLKSPNVIHSRTASYQSYYGSLGESDPYTVSSEGNGHGTSGEDSSPFIPYGDSPYGAIGRIGMASRYHDPTSKYNGSNYHHQYHSNGKNKFSPPPPAQQLASAMAPYVYRSSRNDDYYCGWDE